MSDDSMILKTGGLRVDIPPKDVTFFDLLYFSRASNSTKGGWNSKRHWTKRGLEQIARLPAAVLKDWTERSLEGKYCPEPRKREFCISREMSPARKNAASGAFSIPKASENALNSAIVQRARPDFKLKDRKMALCGYEIPLAADSEGQLKIDLLGYSGNPADNIAIEVVELKKAGNKSDSPLMAFIEAICYGIQIVRLLRGESKFASEFLNGAGLDSTISISAFAPRAINLTVLAPPGYWRYWTEAQDADQMDRAHVEKFQSIVQAINGELARSDPRLSIFFDTLEEWMLQPAASDAPTAPRE